MPFNAANHVADRGRMGVYVMWNDDKSWRCVIKGHFINMTIRQQTKSELDEHFKEGYQGNMQLLEKGVTKSSCH